MMIDDILLQLPLSVIQRTHISGLEPARDTVKVECVLYKDQHATLLVLFKPLTLHIPQAAVHSSLVADTWLA